MASFERWLALILDIEVGCDKIIESHTKTDVVLESRSYWEGESNDEIMRFVCIKYCHMYSKTCE